MVTAILEQTEFESPERDRRLKQLLIEQRVSYVIIFPGWYPHLSDDPILRRLVAFVVEDFTMLGEGTVAGYAVAN
ncbi:MAG: hypothetical protein EXR63_00520 [Dehalococcoidia bacterium]|nr:hypothetical protein [Dehalococcoidia bacterium]